MSVVEGSDRNIQFIEVKISPNYILEVKAHFEFFFFQCYKVSVANEMTFLNSTKKKKRLHDGYVNFNQGLES